jgi:hypothetical protein
MIAGFEDRASSCEETEQFFVEPVGAENLRHLAGCSADRSARRLPGRGMICGLWA